MTNNRLHVLMTQALSAAQSIHIAMCLFDENHRAQSNLNDAFHSALIAAEECRQEHKARLK